MALPTFFAGHMPTADELQSLVPIYAEKSADESVTSNTTVQNDDHLFVTVAANCTYVVEYWLVTISAVETADFKMGWTLPASATIDFGGLGMITSATGTTATSIETVSNLAQTSPTVTINYGVVNGNTNIQGRGRLVTSSTAGTLQLQWAQVASIATAVTLKKGSWLKLQRVL